MLLVGTEYPASSSAIRAGLVDSLASRIAFHTNVHPSENKNLKFKHVESLLVVFKHRKQGPS